MLIIALQFDVSTSKKILNVNVIRTILRLPWLRSGHFVFCTGCRGYVAAILLFVPVTVVT